MALLLGGWNSTFACGTYQTCTDIFFTGFSVTPNPRAEGDSVHIAVDSLEFADWYFTHSSMTFTPVVWGDAGGAFVPAATTQTNNLAPNRYGIFPNYWYNQVTEWTSSLDWNGLDSNGQEVGVAVPLTVSLNAGAAIQTKTVALQTVTGKDLGQPECPIANPCNPAVGNKYQQQVDYLGNELVPAFVRHYNNMAAADVGLGFGWTTRYHKRLRVGTNRLTVIREDGRRERLSKTANAWVADADSHLRITEDSSGFTLKDEDGSIERYAVDGRLLQETDRAGFAITLGYDASYRLSQITGPTGAALTLAYSQNRIDSLTLPSGDLVHFGYTADNLTSVTYSDTKLVQYHYEKTDFPHALTGITDENAIRFATWDFDSAGRMIGSMHAGGAGSYGFAYTSDATGNPQTLVTSPLFAQWTYQFKTLLGRTRFTALQQPTVVGQPTHSDQMVHDANGNIAGHTDFNGNTSCHAYDLTRNLETVRIEGLAAGKTCPATPSTYSPAANTVERKITTAWHPDWRLSAKQAEPKKLTTWVYDGQPDPTNGNAIAGCAPATALLPDGKPIAVLCKQIEQATTDETGAAGFTATATGNFRACSYSYNAIGQVLTEDGPRVDVADVTSYDYYADTTADHRVGDLHTVTDALGHVTIYSDYDGHGHARRIVDANGLVTTLGYDARNRLKTRNVDGKTTQFDYTPTGLLHVLTRPDLSSYTYRYDDAHRLTGIADNLGNQVIYTLDAMGNITRQEYKNPDGTVARTESQVFDALSRLQDAIGAQGQISHYGYDAQGNLKTVTDPKQHPDTQYFYDALDRLDQVLDPASGTTRYRFDGQDHATGLTAPNGADTRYVVDGLGNRTSETGPDRGTLYATYDEAGNLKTRTDARGIVTSYSYDALNRLQTVSYPAAGENVVYSYDSAPGCANGIGRLCQSGRRIPTWRPTCCALIASHLTGRRWAAGPSWIFPPIRQLQCFWWGSCVPALP
jgi:YD repeat-containing protein